ncbi:MAG: type II toxin-antitoxin system RelE/ParE family toxin [Lacipirellulaceae bacterium]
MARVVWSERSLRDLEDILAYIADRSPSAARRYAQKLVGRVDQLERHPHSVGPVVELPEGPYRELLQGPYRLIYRVEGERAIVVTVVHSARLLDADRLQ